MKRILSLCSVLALLFASACGDDKPQPGAPTKQQTSKPQSTKRKKPERPVRVDMEAVKALWSMEPTAPKVENPGTPERVALGNMLYHDKRLSTGGDISCASCHDLANYGQDSKKVSPGTGGQLGERNTPSTWNAARQFAQFWDFRAATVEEQAIMPVINPIEHGFSKPEELIARIKENEDLVEAFAKAFPGDDPVTADNFGLAVGAFERTLVTRSRFDDFIDGNASALTKEEKKGLNAFISVGCTTCHMSRLVGGSMPQKTGVYSPYPDTKDMGRHKVTGKELDKFFFKVPSLLNVEKTAPYNHDGAVATLEAAVKQMAEIQLQVKLTQEQTDSIIAFLKTLTGELPKDILAAVPKDSSAQK